MSEMNQHQSPYSVMEMFGMQVLVYLDRWIVRFDGHGQISGYKRFR